MMENRENIINFDSQCWPEFKMSLREILQNLGFEKMENEGNTYWRICDNNKILDSFPMLLEDDGMGYGVSEEFVISTSVDKKTNSVYMFRERALNGVFNSR